MLGDDRPILDEEKRPRHAEFQRIAQGLVDRSVVGQSGTGHTTSADGEGSGTRSIAFFLQ